MSEGHCVGLTPTLAFSFLLINQCSTGPELRNSVLAQSVTGENGPNNLDCPCSLLLSRNTMRVAVRGPGLLMNTSGMF